MIGTALNLNQMTTVVRHMGVMDQPWVSLSYLSGMLLMDGIDRLVLMVVQQCAGWVSVVSRSSLLGTDPVL